MQLLRIWAVALLAAAGTHAIGAAPSAEPAQFAKTTGEIVVDGHLDEAAWSHARPVTRFFETYPRSLVEPEVRTEARFLYDDENVYIGIWAEEPDPPAVRSGFVRRDTVTNEQDYVEIYVDPLNTRRTALVFRTNVNAVPSDLQYNEDQQLLDPRPDFDFDIRTAMDDRGWRAEFRIPLSTFRYRPGDNQSWAFLIRRNRPRNTKVTIASIPEPRSAACVLCFAGEATGISIVPSAPPLYVTPHLTYTHSARADNVAAGLDAKWLVRSDTVLDLTVAPDFSQVEADDLQLTANAQFTLALKEKRPFFLEGMDLLMMPVNAIYTRAFADPDAGARITHRGGNTDYSALMLRDRGGGFAVEPGPLSSTVAVQDFASTALLGRYTRRLDELTLGALASARWNDGDGENYVYGLDATWTPNTTDRISVQALGSNTTNPNRPDLLPSWDGRQLAGSAYAVSWQHASPRWYASVLESAYSSGFRAWNGFVPQVDVVTSSAVAGLFFYPRNSWLTRIAPSVAYSDAYELGGRRISSSVAPTLSITLPYRTELSLAWHPNAQNTTAAGLATYSYFSAVLVAAPAPWLPGVSVTATSGDGVDFATGKVNAATSLVAEVPLRLADRLELTGSFGYQTQDSREDGQRVFSQRNTQVNLLWHFSGELYAQLLYQDSRLDARAAPTAESQDITATRTTVSGLLSYQTSWQTRFFVGFRHSADSGLGDDTEVFAKLAYVLSPGNR